MEPQGPPFNRGLRTGYLDYTDTMTEEYDYSDYWHFAFKAVDSAKGELVEPDLVESRELLAGDVEELSAARARLMAALEQTGRKKAPDPAARAQIAFDCWLEKAEENDPAEQIEVCKGEFETAIAEVERALTTEGEAYLVFFAWDQAELTPVALAVLDQVQADFLRGRPSPRDGRRATPTAPAPSPTTRRCPRQRARNVARALLQRGVPGAEMGVEWYRRAAAADPDRRRRARAAQPPGRDRLRLTARWRRGADGRRRQPPVTLMCRLTAGLLWRRSMTKSWPLGLRADALEDRLP